MQMIMHNGIHYVPATELAKANDKISGLETNLMLTKVALKQRIDQINVCDSVIDDRNDRIEELETAAQQLICDIKNKRGVIVDTEA